MQTFPQAAVLAQATADVLLMGKRSGVGWLVNEDLILTTASSLGENTSAMIEVQFPNHKSQRADCIERRFSPDDGIDFAL